MSYLPDTPSLLYPRCIIHTGPSIPDQLLELNDEKWIVLQKAKEARRQSKNYQSSKYRPVIEGFPLEPSIRDRYHSKCYKNFTAVSVSAKLPKLGKQLRSAAVSPSTSTAALFGEECIVCDKFAKRSQNKGYEYPSKIETTQAVAKINDVVRILNLDNIRMKITGVDLIAKEAKVHNTCRSRKIKATSRQNKATHDDEHVQEQRSKKELGGQVLDSIFVYVDKFIIKNRRPEHLKSLYDPYIDSCVDLEIEPPISSAQYLCQCLKCQT